MIIVAIAFLASTVAGMFMELVRVVRRTSRSRDA